MSLVSYGFEDGEKKVSKDENIQVNTENMHKETSINKKAIVDYGYDREQNIQITQEKTEEESETGGIDYSFWKESNPPDTSEVIPVDTLLQV